jgi:electron transport complex protein RnfA
MEYIAIILLAALSENFVLAKFLGICPFLGVSKRISTAIGMSMAVIFVMTMASAITWVVDTHLLRPFNIGYLRTIAFILVIASLVQLTELAIQKLSFTLYQALGIYLPLITTNCAVLGVAVLNIQRRYDPEYGYRFIEAILNGLGAAVGFGLALLLFSGMRERIELMNVPSAFKGAAIALICAGLLSLTFMGFAGLVPAK